MISNLDYLTPGPDSQKLENDSINTGKDFNNVSDNYDPNDLDAEDDADLDDDDDIFCDSDAAEPDLDEDGIARVFPNADDNVPDPDQVDDTADFDDEIDPDYLDIPDED